MTSVQGWNPLIQFAPVTGFPPANEIWSPLIRCGPLYYQNNLQMDWFWLGFVCPKVKLFEQTGSCVIKIGFLLLNVGDAWIVFEMFQWNLFAAIFNSIWSGKILCDQFEHFKYDCTNRHGKIRDSAHWQWVQV